MRTLDCLALALLLLPSPLAAAHPSPWVADASSTVQIIPSVASTPGNFGSFYKTAVQIHNASNVLETGHFVFHPAGVSGSPNDPTLSYSIAAGHTQSVSDLLVAMGQSGIGSADLVPATGGVPVAVVRVYNDAGAAGTTGLTEEVFGPSDALSAGDRVALLTPPDFSNFRFNVGVRSLGSGATLVVSVNDSNGVPVTSVTKSYPPDEFEQKDVFTFLGLPSTALSGDDTLTIQVTAGNVIVYGATADNTTQDPSGQFPKRLP